MATDKECLEYARECMRLAELTTDSDLRDHLLTLASAWMEMAKDKAASEPTSLLA